MSQKRFANQVCWIIGASSGIGHALAVLLASEGAIVYASARRVSELTELANQNRAHIFPLVLDVRDIAAIELARDTLLKQSLKLDLLITCAGIYDPTPVEQLSASKVHEVIDINLLGSSNLICSCIPTFLKQGFGHIAGVASVVGFRGLPHAAAYGASKAALIHFLESIRFDLEKSGILVSIINPGFVKSRLTKKNTFSMPFLIDEVTAAQKIADGLCKKSFEICFPWQMALIAKTLRILPYRIYHALIKKMMDRE